MVEKLCVDVTCVGNNRVMDISSSAIVLWIMDISSSAFDKTCTTIRI